MSLATSSDIGEHGLNAEHGVASKVDNPPRESPGDRSARAAQRITALGEMTAGIAHDFRNILTVIESGLNLAERFSGDPEKAQSCLAAARNGVRRGVDMTTRLLTFAKRKEEEPSAENLNELLQNLLMFLKYGAGPALRVVLELAPDLPKCVVDPLQFNPAILNLVVNARDAMPSGGTILISTAPINGGPGAMSDPTGQRGVLVQVKDTGKGMTEDVMRRIFDPYFTTKGETGTGLGIPQVCAFMKQVGGSVSVESVLGKGTIFNLVFPGEHLSDPALNVCRQVDRWVNEGGAIGDQPIGQ